MGTTRDQNVEVLIFQEAESWTISGAWNFLESNHLQVFFEQCSKRMLKTVLLRILKKKKADNINRSYY